MFSNLWILRKHLYLLVHQFLYMNVIVHISVNIPYSLPVSLNQKMVPSFFEDIKHIHDQTCLPAYIYFIKYRNSFIWYYLMFNAFTLSYWVKALVTTLLTTLSVLYNKLINILIHRQNLCYIYSLEYRNSYI